MFAIKPILSAALLTVAFAAPALAGPGPGNALNRLDKQLTHAELTGRIKQGSRADRIEDRIDLIEDRFDRRESIRDRAVALGPRDLIEDRIDAAESRRDRRENRIDRRR